MHHGYPYIWNEMPVMVTFESDWRKAERILGDILASAAPDVDEGVRKYEQRVERFILSHPDTKPSIYTWVADSGVVLTLRYMVEPEHRRSSEREIWEAILDAFAPHWDIDFAYPTQREYLNHMEGKRKPE
jgi:small-conductance mechanosensitive channel